MASATLAILQDLNPAPKLSRRIQIEHDTSMANTKTCVRMLEMTAILKRCADELGVCCRTRSDPVKHHMSHSPL